ncbi:MAG TPA: tryptophan 2,3-dioxygenase family protein [Caulobacteraceae bacterium]|nr:tryptophan 2,3-dioxygenase family protein [Caulobacteraceae bacterium]
MADSELTYARYLKLDRVLSAQAPTSGAHDEMLFIVIHQVSELWMKLVLHELSAARAAIAVDDLGPALKMIARVVRVLSQMIQAWDVLATLTPTEYLAIRPALGASSGFQSRQFRLIEVALGLKDPAILANRAGAERATLEAALAEPSLYDQTVALLGRRGFTGLEGKGQARSNAIEAAWLAVYRQPERWWDLYELAEKLVDLDFGFARWRFAHLKTVERIIGWKSGTGGSAGAAYLARTLTAPLFPELARVRTEL